MQEGPGFHLISKYSLNIISFFWYFLYELLMSLRKCISWTYLSTNFSWTIKVEQGPAVSKANIEL